MWLEVCFPRYCVCYQGETGVLTEEEIKGTSKQSSYCFC